MLIRWGQDSLSSYMRIGKVVKCAIMTNTWGQERCHRFLSSLGSNDNPDLFLSKPAREGGGNLRRCSLI